jgi:hypothetical protein
VSVLLLLAAGAAADPWAIPAPNGAELFLVLQDSERSYTLTPHDKVAEEADGKERIDPPLPAADREATEACRALVAAGSHEEAEARLAELLARNAANHDARMLVALSLHRRGLHAEALAALRESLIGNRRNPEGWKLLEEVARKLGRKVVRPRLKPRGWVAEGADGTTLAYADASREADMPWMFYAVARAHYRHEGRFARDHPGAKEYRFTFREQLFAAGAAVVYAEAQKPAERSADARMLLAQKKAKTIVPFLFFATYPEPLADPPERHFESLKPILEKYFNENILR